MYHNKEYIQSLEGMLRSGKKRDNRPRIVDDINEALEELWMKELSNCNILLTWDPLLEKMQQKKNTFRETTRD